jgi:hypothetical protein
MPGLNQLACLPTEPRNKAKEADWRGKTDATEKVAATNFTAHKN